MANDNLPDGVRSLLASQGKTYISLESETSGDGNTFAFERDDYTPDSMAIVNKMAVDTVGESQNIHKLTEQRVSSRITQDNGKPSLIVDGGPGSANSYSSIISDGDAANNDSSGVRKFENASNSEQFFGLNNQFEVIKGNAEPTNDNQKKYTTLLVDYNKEKGNSTIAKAVAELQSTNNRFSADNKFLTDGQKEDESGANTIPIQNIPGKYTPQVWPNTETGTNVELRNLKNLGVQILLKASGEYYVPDNLDDVAGALAARATSLAPGYVRLGLPLPMSEIQVDGIIDNANPEFSKNKSPSLSGTPTLSHGSYYNPLAPFDSFDSRFNIAGAAVLVATVAGIVKALALLVDTSEKTNEVLGAVFSTTSKSFFNIQYKPKYPFIKCVDKGLEKFFSLEGENLGAAVLNAVKRFNEAPGYYNTILRGVVRLVKYDIVNNGLSIANLAGAADSSTTFNAASNRDLDINRNIGLSNDPTNILNIVRSIANSKLFGFIDILAQMGDVALKLEKLGLTLNSNDNLLEPGPSNIENFSDFVEENNSYGNGEGNGGAEYLIQRRQRINPASLIKKDKLSTDAAESIGHNNLLAWANATTPSTYLLPKTITNAAEKLGGTGAVGLTTKLSAINGLAKYDSGNRLPGEMVDKIERLLDASYMPFYFHDLRTNEIISFHAFLESVTDQYAAEYNEQTAYGRIGKIHTYKNTDRSISMSFLTVATNDRDFDEMWWKINKLITMVYPQYTKGRQIERGNQKFIQPFSQLPSASPLIRLRLGDLFKTNYSKFHLARLFGLGESDDVFSVNPEAATNSNSIEQIVIGSDVRRKMEQGIFAIGDKIKYIRTDYAPSVQGRRNSNNRRTARRRREIQDNSLNNQPFGLVGTIVDIINAENKIYKARFENYHPINTRPEHIIYADSSGDIVTRYEIDNETLERKIAARLPPRQQNNQSDIETLFSVSSTRSFFNDSNPIFQSFNTVRGKGLPGFIKSIDFDWSEMMWETADGSKAPKSCKISISFSPIWDISPGIDSNGFNTAPVYSIGNSTNELAKTHFGDNNRAENITTRLVGSAEGYRNSNNNTSSVAPSDDADNSVGRLE